MSRAVAAITLVLAAACSASGGRPGAGGTTSDPRASNPSPTGSSTLPAGAATGTPPPGAGGATPAASFAPLGTSSDGRVVLAKACVHRGDAADQQTVTVTAGVGETVTYSTYYSDYSTELSRSDYTTGHGFGQAGTDGRFRATWTVPVGATPGRATVRVTASDMADAQEAAFIVVKQGERCP